MIKCIASFTIGLMMASALAQVTYKDSTGTATTFMAERYKGMIKYIVSVDEESIERIREACK